MEEQFSKEIDLDANNNNNSKLDRFAKISAKISQIKGNDNTNTQKVEKIEQKINTVEDTFNTNLDSLEKKYSILKEQLVKFSKLIEEDRANKEKAKNKNYDDLKQFETKVKGMMTEEKEFIKNYTDNAVKRLEGLILKYEKDSKEENDSLKTTIEGLKNCLNTELPNLNAKIDEENNERGNNIKHLVEEMNQQIGRAHV